MRCMHCLVHFRDNEKYVHLGKDVDKEWVVAIQNCPSCGRMNLWLANAETWTHIQGEGWRTQGILRVVPIRPKGSIRPCPPEVPASIAEDFREACAVLPDSPKASAALSRRCLQHVLREAAEVKRGNLADEIQQVLNSGSLPSHLAETIDAVRNVGNFAAHPIKSQHSGEIVPVEPAEAEWNLDVLESLFDFYYVQPATIAKKRDALNQKLDEMGKKPMK